MVTGVGEEAGLIDGNDFAVSDVAGDARLG